MASNKIKLTDLALFIGTICGKQCKPYSFKLIHYRANTYTSVAEDTSQSWNPASTPVAKPYILA